MNLRSRFVQAIVLVMLGCLMFAALAPVQAAKNCMTKQCIVISYAGPANGEAPGNTNCLIGTIAGQQWAYSDDIAVPTTFGQNSIGGNPSPTTVEGQEVQILTWTADCPATPTSGEVLSRKLGMGFPASFPKTCVTGD